MRNSYRLAVTVGAATLGATISYIGLTLGLLFLLRRPDLGPASEFIDVAATVLIPTGAAAWWIFWKLRPNNPSRTARDAAFAFCIFTPVSLGVAVLLSTFVGGYAERLSGNPMFAPVGAFLGIVIVTTLLSVVPSVFVLWIARREGAHQAP